MKLNKLFKKDISLIKDVHKYEHIDDPDINFTSVTTFVENFFHGFDSIKIANKLIKNYSKYSKYTVESLLEEWEQKAKYGTYIHEEIEKWIIDETEPKEIKSIKSDLSACPENASTTATSALTSTISPKIFTDLSPFTNFLPRVF